MTYPNPHQKIKLDAPARMLYKCGMDYQNCDPDRAREYLIARAGTWKDIARETGIDYAWLSKFAREKVNQPLSRVAELLAYFESETTLRIVK
jgi:hypothetical protein